MDEESFRDEKNYWPIRLLKTLGRLPHDYGTWLGWGHSVPNGDPPEPYAPGTGLCGAVVIPPFMFKELFEVEGEPTIHIFQILPVTAAEMALKLEGGLDHLLETLETRFPDIYGPVDPDRPSAV
jgi:hypothetical protein